MCIPYRDFDFAEIPLSFIMQYIIYKYIILHGAIGNLLPIHFLYKHRYEKFSRAVVSLGGSLQVLSKMAG